MRGKPPMTASSETRRGTGPTDLSLRRPPRRGGRCASSVPAVRRAAVEALEGRVLFAAGDLDLTFGSILDPGKARIQVQAGGTATPDAANAVAVLPDDRVLLVGQTGPDANGTRFAVA